MRSALFEVGVWDGHEHAQCAAIFTHCSVRADSASTSSIRSMSTSTSSVCVAWT